MKTHSDDQVCKNYRIFARAGNARPAAAGCGLRCRPTPRCSICLKDHAELLRRLQERFTLRELLRAWGRADRFRQRRRAQRLARQQRFVLVCTPEIRWKKAIRSLGGRRWYAARPVAIDRRPRRRGNLRPRRAGRGRRVHRRLGGRRRDPPFGRLWPPLPPTEWSIWAARASSCSARKWACRWSAAEQSDPDEAPPKSGRQARAADRPEDSVGR